MLLCQGVLSSPGLGRVCVPRQFTGGPLGKVHTRMYIVSNNDKAGKINEVGKELESGGKCLVSLGHSQIGGI